MKKYIAELLGTFALAFVVTMSVFGQFAVATPLLAALVLTIFVYTIGSLSGTHINPAVTLGLWSIKKITNKEALFYVVAQLLGGIIALLVAKAFNPAVTSILATTNFSTTQSLMIAAAEILGTAFFAFGIASVVYGKVNEKLSGVVIGASLLLGITIAALSGSFGILNPAVALSLGAFNLVFIIAPIVGSIIGMNTYRYLSK